MELYIILALCALNVVLLIVLLTKNSSHAVDDAERRLQEELRSLRRDTADSIRELSKTVADAQKENLKTNSDYQEKMNTTLTASMTRLQDSNEKKLDLIRQTVDEKLTSTLSQRLDVSFKTVGEQLAKVYESLGEMKHLASGVSDLQRVLTNVKARGTWAEVQLGNILEQTLTHDQYAQNVSIRNNSERVEFAIKIPSREDDHSSIWLPIDSKFPQEDYVRLCDAAERADKDATDAAGKALETRIRGEAATISRLYIDVPRTTDFAILFLPTEGLYAEILRRPGLTEELQNKYRVMVCGPTTITAFLNTLRMGFRTIALDKRAAEVWKILGAAKTQYATFETLLTKARRKIDEAGNALDDAQHRNGMVLRKLNKVEEVEGAQSDALLGLVGTADTDDEETNG